MFKKNREVLLSDNQILKSNQMDVIANIYVKKKKIYQDDPKICN